jgi:hypothetical protein
MVAGDIETAQVFLAEGDEAAFWHFVQSHECETFGIIKPMILEDRRPFSGLAKIRIVGDPRGYWVPAAALDDVEPWTGDAR